jgi:hypothetical protein
MSVAECPSGEGTARNTVYPGSNPGSASACHPLPRGDVSTFMIMREKMPRNGRYSRHLLAHDHGNRVPA